MRQTELVFASLLLIFASSASGSIDKKRMAEKAAVPTASHPYAGFWKSGGCAEDFGLAIAPADGPLYSVSFCGPGGCFQPGTYRPSTKLVGDPAYRVIDKNTIEVLAATGFLKYVRCEKR